MARDLLTHQISNGDNLGVGNRLYVMPCASRLVENLEATKYSMSVAQKVEGDMAMPTIVFQQ